MIVQMGRNRAGIAVIGHVVGYVVDEDDARIEIPLVGGGTLDNKGPIIALSVVATRLAGVGDNDAASEECHPC